MSDLDFRLDVSEPARRRIAVVLEVDRVAAAPRDASSAEFFLPTWTPGSYLIREYARHFGPVRAVCASTGGPLQCAKSGKNRYRVALGPDTRRIRLDYWVYAHELTVRTADVTAEHAYWNHACVLLWPVDRRDLAARVTLQTPPGWDLAGGVPHRRLGDGRFEYDLADLDESIDSPFLAGTFQRLAIEARGVRHELVLDGLGPVPLHGDLEGDVRRVIDCAADVFGGELPYPHYTFLCLFAEHGYGGLEHANSCTLLGPRASLAGGKGYREFLGLLAHELFHVWNVKRMRPAELWSFDYEVENLTSMLWLAEGWTAYYDDLLCRRAGVLGLDDYLAIVARNLGNLWGSVGRFRQSLGEASYDAWIRYYRPDENTRNITQNYYGNGALAAMVLDLTIREATAGDRCLDHAVAALYRETFGAGRGYRLEDVERCLSTAAGRDMSELLQELTAQPLDPDFEPLLQRFGLRLLATDADRPFLGLALEHGRTRVASVTDDTPAHEAGIAPGDEILAFDGLRVTSERWNDVLRVVARPDRPLRVLLATRGVIAERVVTPTKAGRRDVRLELAPGATPEQIRLRAGWLGDSAPTTTT